MATRFINDKSEKFYFLNANNQRKSLKLIFGDEVNTLTTQAPSGVGWQSVQYRGRRGELRQPNLTADHCLEMYFLDVGQGDAAFIVTPNNTKILVDGGLHDRALGFLIWKYQLDNPNNTVTIDHLFLSHADEDHVSGLIPLLEHPDITVNNIWHNGIGVYNDPSLNTPLGVMTNDRLRTRHSSIVDLGNTTLSDGFNDWIIAVSASAANYEALDATTGELDIGDPEIVLEVLGPVLEPDGTYDWFGNKAETINGHSLVFRLTCGFVRTFFSGDLNTKGSQHILSRPNAALRLNSHIFKSPHHGSHDYYQPLLNAIAPMVTVISSGDSPDHGHPRASFLGGVGIAGRGDSPLIFCTEIAATFVDAGDNQAVDEAETTTLGDLDFSSSNANLTARRRFKKVLSGIINVRTDGHEIYTARRVRASYQWELYDPITPVE